MFYFLSILSFILLVLVLTICISAFLDHKPITEKKTKQFTISLISLTVVMVATAIYILWFEN